MEESSLKDTIPLEEVQLENDLTYEEKLSRFLRQQKESLVRGPSSYAKYSGVIIPRKKQLGKEKMNFRKITLTYLLTNPNLEGEIHLKGVRFVTSQISS